MVRWELSPRLGSPAQFAALRQLLAGAGYSGAAICERMGIGSLAASLGMRAACAPADRLELLIHLFLLSHPVAESEAAGLLSEDSVGLLKDLALVEGDGAGRLGATVSLYPVGEVWIVSDKNQTSEGDRQEAHAPRVFSAITAQTEEFLAMLPRTPCPAFLELCAGAGAAALQAAARFAVHAWAFDVSERACHFAEFGKRLNGLENVTVRPGDLYAPAGHRTFDRIAAHPPYVPSLRSEQLFRDGGEDGERLTKRIVEGLPSHLHPGGWFYCLCLLAQIPGQESADRVRQWLREGEGEFDLMLVVRRTAEPARLILDNWPQRFAQAGDLERWWHVLRRRRIESFAYVTVLLHRHAGPARPVTVVREAGDDWSIEDAHAVLRFERTVTDCGASAALESAPLEAAPGVRMETAQTLEAGQWPAPRVTYHVPAPFRCQREGDAWLGAVLSRANGTVTARELYAAAAPGGVPWDEFARAVAGLVSGGLLRARGGSAPWPPVSSSPSRTGR